MHRITIMKLRCSISLLGSVVPKDSWSGTGESHTIKRNIFLITWIIIMCSYINHLHLDMQILIQLPILNNVHLLNTKLQNKNTHNFLVLH